MTISRIWNGAGKFECVIMSVEKKYEKSTKLFWNFLFCESGDCDWRATKKRKEKFDGKQARAREKKTRKCESSPIAAVESEAEGGNNNSLSLKVCASLLDSFARPFAEQQNQPSSIINHNVLFVLEIPHSLFPPSLSSGPFRSTLHFVNFLLLLLLLLSLSLPLCSHVFYLFWIAVVRNPHKHTSVTNWLNKTCVLGYKVAGKNAAQAQLLDHIFSKKIVPKISFHTFDINKTDEESGWDRNGGEREKERWRLMGKAHTQRDPKRGWNERKIRESERQI